MMPLAPALFSTTTACEIERPSWSAVKRASVSVTPPGGHGTINFIGLSGYWASTGIARASRAVPTPRMHPRRVFIVPPMGSDSVRLKGVDDAQLLALQDGFEGPVLTLGGQEPIAVRDDHEAQATRGQAHQVSHDAVNSWKLQTETLAPVRVKAKGAAGRNRRSCAARSARCRRCPAAEAGPRRARNASERTGPGRRLGGRGRAGIRLRV